MGAKEVLRRKEVDLGDSSSRVSILHFIFRILECKRIIISHESGACNPADSMSTVAKIFVRHEKWECQLRRCFVSDFYDLYGIPWNQIPLCPADKLPFVKKKMKRKGFTHRDIPIGMFRAEKNKCIQNG